MLSQDFVLPLGPVQKVPIRFLSRGSIHRIEFGYNLYYTVMIRTLPLILLSFPQSDSCYHPQVRSQEQQEPEKKKKKKKKKGWKRMEKKKKKKSRKKKMMCCKYSGFTVLKNTS